MAAVSVKQEELRQRIVNIENRSTKLLGLLFKNYSIVPHFDVVGGDISRSQYC
jgi:hypothetical protein